MVNRTKQTTKDKSGLKDVPNTINQAKLNFTQKVQVETASSRARTAATDPGPKIAPKTTMTTTNNNEFASDADDTMDEVDASLNTALISPKFSDDVWDLQRLSYITVVTRARAPKTTKNELGFGTENFIKCDKDPDYLWAWRERFDKRFTDTPKQLSWEGAVLIRFQENDKNWQSLERNVHQVIDCSKIRSQTAQEKIEADVLRRLAIGPLNTTSEDARVEWAGKGNRSAEQAIRQHYNKPEPEEVDNYIVNLQDGIYDDIEDDVGGVHCERHHEIFEKEKKELEMVKKPEFGEETRPGAAYSHALPKKKRNGLSFAQVVEGINSTSKNDREKLSSRSGTEPKNALTTRGIKESKVKLLDSIQAKPKLRREGQLQLNEAIHDGSEEKRVYLSVEQCSKSGICTQNVDDKKHHITQKSTEILGIKTMPNSETSVPQKPSSRMEAGLSVVGFAKSTRKVQEGIPTIGVENAYGTLCPKPRTRHPCTSS